MQPGHGLPARPASFMPPASQNGPRATLIHPHVGPSAHQVPVSYLQHSLAYPYPMSSHYAHAYMQQSLPVWQPTTPQGYSLSSTYTPQASTSYQTYQTNYISQPASSRIQVGHSRCTKQGCAFTGFPKAVETHMMDRHLIYPPGWEHRKRKPDWDADPSLKGKPVPIQGTTLKLDSPEAIEQWIADRKKRFPTAERVEEKQKKMEEAIARGQLAFSDRGGHSHKRRRLDEGHDQSRDNRRNGMRGRGNRGRGGSRQSQIPRKNTSSQEVGSSANDPGRHQVPDISCKDREEDKTAAKTAADEDDSPSDSDSDAAPETLSSKAPLLEVHEHSEENAVENPPRTQDIVAPIRKLPPKQPRQPVHNPFATRPMLLRNLLLPEIRTTVSNLSQAIRFLVDNDFLENVELKPGQAAEQLIEEVSDTGALGVEDGESVP